MGARKLPLPWKDSIAARVLGMTWVLLCRSLCLRFGRWKWGRGWASAGGASQLTCGGARVFSSGFLLMAASNPGCFLTVMASWSCWNPGYGSGGVALGPAAGAPASVLGTHLPDHKRGSSSLSIQVCNVAVKATFKMLNLFLQLSNHSMSHLLPSKQSPSTQTRWSGPFSLYLNSD